MDVYFYCTYAHSRAGFVLTRLEHDGLTPQVASVPEVIRDLFSHDRFMVLWREFAPGLPEAAMLGLRGLRGRMADGRTAVVNLALLAPEPEQDRIEAAALDVLADWNAFQERIMGWLHLGGEAGYSLDAHAFLTWLDSRPSASFLRRCCGLFSRPARLLFATSTGRPRKTERERLRFAVCTCAWKQARLFLGLSGNWAKMPPQVITTDRFQNEFVRHSPLWEERNLTKE